MDGFSQLWQDTLGPFESYPLLGAAVTIVLFGLLALLADRLLSGALRRLVGRSETEFDDRLVDILHRPIFSTVALIGLILATYSLDLSVTAERITVLMIQTLLLIIWLGFGLRFSKLVFEAMRRNRRRFTFVQAATEPVFANAFAVFLFLAGVYSLFLIWDINVGGLLASAGIVGLALSFAAQDTLSNLFAGIAILADRPYEVGDFIVLDGEDRGQVTHIGLRSTRLLTRDDVEVSIPNGVMGSSKIVNEAGGPPRQFRIAVSVGVAYGSDVDEVGDVLLAIGQGHPDTITTPEPRVRFRRFGDSSLEFDLQCWIEDPADQGRVIHDLNCEVYRRFAAAGITIPFPQQDVYIKEIP